MNEMIEKVAKGMAAAEGWRWSDDRQMLDRAAAGLQNTPRERDTWRNRARAAIDALKARTEMSGWRSVDTAPRDGTWILLRGRNAAGQPMIPVVAAWMPAGARHQGWADSGSFKPVDNLAADEGADWHPLP